MINVSKKTDNEFDVTIEQGGSTSNHAVTVTDDYYQKLTGGKIDKQQLIEQAFEFLLQREPKESIMSRFDLTVIKRYFPDFEKNMKSGL